MISLSGRSSGSHPDTGSYTAGSIVSGERVIRALYGVADLRQARALSDEDVRCALAIAEALGEVAAEKVGGPFRKGAYASTDLPLDRATGVVLAAKSGATPRQVDRGLELLLASQVLLRVPGRAEVRLARECLVDIRTSFPSAPLPQIRQSLLARHAALMPALGVLRYLRELAPDATGWVVSSLEQAAERTFFRRSTVARALVDLEAVGAIERAHGPGLRGHYRLVAGDAATPAAGPEPEVAANDGLGVFPGGRSIPSSPTENMVAVRAHEELADRSSVDGEVRRNGAGFDAPTVGTLADAEHSPAIIEISGVEFPIPYGATLAPEIDPDGRLWYRLGSARLGPIILQ